MSSPTPLHLAMPEFAGTLYPFRLYPLSHIPWEAPHLETLTAHYQVPQVWWPGLGGMVGRVHNWG